MRGLQQTFTQVPIAILFLGVTAISLLAQDVKNRELKLDSDFTTTQMPVEIVSIKLNGNELRAGEKIKGDDDWLRGLSFTLKNVSGQPISFIGIGLRFPRVNGLVVYILSYGVDLSRGQPITELSPPSIQPGDTVDLVLTKENYEVLLRVLAAGEGSKSTETVPYHLARVCFERDRYLIWEGGYLKRWDPGALGKFIVVERYVLPGKQN